MKDELTTIPPLHLGSSAWAIRRDVLPRIIEAHRTALMPGWQAAAEHLAAAAPLAAKRNMGQRAGGAVAVLPLTGVITPRGSLISMLFGGGYGGLQGFREEFRDAVSSPDVGAIVIDVDSPGGLIDLVPETAAEIREARGSKPIIAVANTMAASAAFWIATQADELVVTPSGCVGSVGVYMVHEDWSGWNAQKGIDPTYISAGRYKTEGNPDEPLSEEAQADWQAEVDGLYAMFVEEVAAGRGCSDEDVRDNYGEGRTLQAPQAFEAGMVDRVDTLETVIGGLLAPGSTGSKAALAGRLAQTTPIETVPTPKVEEIEQPQPVEEPSPAAERVELDAEARAARAAVLFG